MLIDYNKSIEQVLTTGTYPHKYKIFSEQMAVFQYLYTEKKKSKEQIYEFWKTTDTPITNSYRDTREEDDLKAMFNFIWNLAMTRNPLYATHYHEAKIWKEELDYINSLPVAQWYRKYLVCLLALAKTFPSQPFPYTTLTIESVILKKCGLQKEMKDSKRKKMAAWNNELHLYDISWPKFGGPLQMKVLIDYNIKDAGGSIDYNDVPLVVTDVDLTGIEKVLNMCASGSVNCKECGKQIFVGPNYQRAHPLCDDCSSKPRKKVVCDSCGKEYCVPPHYRKKEHYCSDCQPMTISAFSALTGIHPQTLAKWDQNGQLTGHRTSTGKRYYCLSDLSRVPSKLTHKRKYEQNSLKNGG